MKESTEGASAVTRAETTTTGGSSPMTAAYKKRRRISFWAVPVLVAIPLWAYVYAGTLSPPDAGDDVAIRGAQLYGSACAGCHGAGGAGGGVAPGFTGGAIYETFPSFITHFEWVRLGSDGWREQHGDNYGATNKPMNNGMPGFTHDQISDADLLFIVAHERRLGGENPDTNDAEVLMDVALLMSQNPEMTLVTALEEAGVETLPTARTAGTTSAGKLGSDRSLDARPHVDRHQPITAHRILAAGSRPPVPLRTG